MQHYFGYGGTCVEHTAIHLPNPYPFCLSPNNSLSANYTQLNLSTVESTGRGGGKLQDLGALHAWLGNTTTSRMWNG